MISSVQEEEKKVKFSDLRLANPDFYKKRGSILLFQMTLDTYKMLRIQTYLSLLNQLEVDPSPETLAEFNETNNQGNVEE